MRQAGFRGEAEAEARLRPSARPDAGFEHYQAGPTPRRTDRVIVLHLLWQKDDDDVHDDCGGDPCREERGVALSTREDARYDDARTG